MNKEGKWSNSKSGSNKMCQCKPMVLTVASVSVNIQSLDKMHYEFQPERNSIHRNEDLSKYFSGENVTFINLCIRNKTKPKRKL